jgi:LacI family transcriptional regulator
MAQTEHQHLPYHFSKKNKQVALIIEAGNEYDKELLKGIKKYTQENEHWSIYISDYGKENTDLSWLSSWRGDGILARIENKQIAEYISELHLPTIDLSLTRTIQELPYVATKDFLMAQMAADHLTEQGLRRFGFCGDTKRHRYSKLNMHFQAYLEKTGYPCHSLCTYSSAGKSQMEQKLQLARWVEGLPKPIGILVCSQGEQLLEACQLAGVSVPEEAAIIELDHDEILCELVDRQLSTVILNTSKAGYNAASLLDQMMREHDDTYDTSILETEEHPHRPSADELAKKDKMVSDALKFIHNNACDGITVNDILNKVPLSRRILEHRFRKVLGRTPHEEIVAARLKYVKQLLSETNLTLVSIADRTGFKHAEYLSVAFKREIGISPSQYRKIHTKRRLAVNCRVES